MFGISNDLVRVLEMPPFNGNFHFSGPGRAVFLEHDFFNTTSPDGLEEFIKKKPYYRDDRMYLVLGKTFSFTINYDRQFEKPAEPKTVQDIPSLPSRATAPNRGTGE